MSILVSRYALFNGWNFNNVPGLQVYAINPPGQQDKTLDIFPLGRRNARKVSSGFFQANTFPIGIYITATTREALEQSLDTLYKNIQSQEGTLTVPMSGTTRNYTATYRSTVVNNPVSGTSSPSGNTADLTLVFECSDSYGYDDGPTLICNLSNQTTSLVTVNYNQGGGAEWQVPVVKVQVDALTGSNPSSITIGNNANGMACTVSRNWLAHDLLIVDTRNKTVQVNGADVAFTGALPEFNIGAQTLTYNDTFTTRTAKIYANVVNRWN